MTQDLSQPVPSTSGSMFGAWNRFWFTPRSPLTLGFIRIFAGITIFYIYMVYSFNLYDLFGEHALVPIDHMNHIRTQYQPGVLPWGWTQLSEAEQAAVAPRGWPVFSLFFHVTDNTGVRVIHICSLIVLALFTIGFCTRVTSVLAWIATISYIQRTPTTLFGVDTMTNIMLLYLMIGPSGAALSVDRLIARWWKRRRGESLGPPEPRISANLAIRLMQVHFCFVYLVSGISKLQGDPWWAGTALWGTMANYSFAPMDSVVYVDFLRFLSKHRWLWELIMLGGTWFTLFIEISFVFLIWRPRWRWVMICASVLLHTGIALIMGLSTFSMAMFCFVSCFIPAETIQGFLSSFKRKARTSTGSNQTKESQEALLAGQT